MQHKHLIGAQWRNALLLQGPRGQPIARFAPVDAAITESPFDKSQVF
jgi:hypothetical protein